MNAEIRRATIDDLPELKKLWWRENLDVNALASRIGEFQLAIEDGKIIAALGLQISKRQGKIHGELFADPSRADVLRALLWQRMQTWANNFGLFRLWTSLTAEFWQKNGFQIPDAEQRAPAEFSEKEKPLHVLQLGPEPPEDAAALGELSLLRETSRGRNKRFLARVEVIAIIVPALIFLGIKFWHIYHLSSVRIPPAKIKSVKVTVFEWEQRQGTNAAASSNAPAPSKVPPVPEKPDDTILSNSPSSRRI